MNVLEMVKILQYYCVEWWEFYVLDFFIIVVRQHHHGTCKKKSSLIWLIQVEDFHLYILYVASCIRFSMSCFHIIIIDGDNNVSSCVRGWTRVDGIYYTSYVPIQTDNIW